MITANFPIPTVSKVKQIVSTALATASTLATQIPFDDTKPQNTEGTEVITLAITPTSATNNLLIQFDAGLVCASLDVAIIAALFQDANANALQVAVNWAPAAHNGGILPLSYVMTAGTTSATTFKIRIGRHDGVSTVTINGQGGGRIFGGATSLNLTIIEYEP